MNIGGFQKTSLLDYPDTISAIIWTIGCNFRCPFCYNKNLVLGNVQPIPEEEILAFLKKRSGLLEGLVITGGEPLMQEDIVGFCQQVKKLDYLIKIDTNGTYPKRLQELLDHTLVDYIAMDIKAPQKKYHQLTGVKTPLARIKQSIDLITKAGIAYEFRTTVVPELLTKDDIVAIAQWIQGSERYYLQQFKINPPLVSLKAEQIKPYPPAYLKEIIAEIQPYVDHCELRGV